MGIDAEMLIRGVKNADVTDEKIKEWSWKLCKAIGAEHFWINADEGFSAISKTLQRYRDDSDPQPGSEYWQDGETIFANKDECLLEVRLAGRYYGKGYERGDIMTYCYVAKWIEENIPNAVVWYGGDSSGALAVPFTKELREELISHLFSEHGRDYYQFDNFCADTIPKPKPCPICPNNIYRGNRCGWGNGYAAYSCPGCGAMVETRNGGESYEKAVK